MRARTGEDKPFKGEIRPDLVLSASRLCAADVLASHHHAVPTQVHPAPPRAPEHTRLVTVRVGQNVRAFLDAREVATLLGLSSATVRAEIRTGRIPSMRMGRSGRRVLVPSSWVAGLQAEAMERQDAPRP